VVSVASNSISHPHSGGGTFAKYSLKIETLRSASVCANSPGVAIVIGTKRVFERSCAAIARARSDAPRCWVFDVLVTTMRMAFMLGMGRSGGGGGRYAVSLRKQAPMAMIPTAQPSVRNCLQCMGEFYACLDGVRFRV